MTTLFQWQCDDRDLQEPSLAISKRNLVLGEDHASARPDCAGYFLRSHERNEGALVFWVQDV